MVMFEGVTNSLVGLVPVAVAGAGVLTITERAFQNKALEGKSVKKKSKGSADYINKSTTKGERCSNCSLYRSSSRTCKVVQGTIAPGGHSKFWTDD